MELANLEELKVKLGERIRTLRKEKGVSIRQFLSLIHI